MSDEESGPVSWFCDICYEEVTAPNKLQLEDRKRAHKRDKHGIFDKSKGENPADMIPDLPENKEARDFLLNAPTRGLVMPLGKEVKVMKCWRCGKYGHRTGDRECELFMAGNPRTEGTLKKAYDPMAAYISANKQKESEETNDRVALYKTLLQSSSDSSSDDEKGSSKKRKKKSKKKEKHKKHSKSKDSKKHKHKKRRHSDSEKTKT
eukprot:m.13652 g.13652  ORF g.13652 m.13652 type:complete len:207 (-) comp4893_c0_seq1:31-651(-)